MNGVDMRVDGTISAVEEAKLAPGGGIDHAVLSTGRSGMQHTLRRLFDDIAGSWKVMPKSQAIQWYGSLLRSLPEIVKHRTLYAADLRMPDHVRFRFDGRDFEFDLAPINSTGGNAYAFLREFFVRKIYFRAFGPIA